MLAKKNMSRFFLSISFLFFLINISNAARENTGYDRGLINKNIKVINELLDKKNYKAVDRAIKKRNKK